MRLHERRLGTTLRSKLRRHRYPGRKPLDNRAVLTDILFILQTGLPWDLLLREMGCGSRMSCWRRLGHWQEACMTSARVFSCGLAFWAGASAAEAV